MRSKKSHFIIGTLAVAVFLWAGLAHGQGSSLWKLTGTKLEPVVGSWGLKITSLGSAGNPCINVGTTGIFATTTCGAGGITSLNGLSGATQTFTDPDDTNVTLTIGSSGTNHAFTMGWSGTLAAGRGGTGISSPTAAGVLLGSYAGGAWQQLATSSLGLAISDTTGVLAVSRGGTGVASLSDVLGTANQINVANGIGRVIGGNVTLSFPNPTIFTQASTTRLSVFDTAYFGGTATSTFNSAGVLTLITPLVITSGGTGASSFSSSQLLYGAGTEALQSVATGTLSGAGALTVTVGRYVIGGSATVAITAGGIGDTELAFDTGQALTTASSPTFAGLTLSSPLTVPNGGTGWATINSGTVLYGNGTGRIATTTAGTAGNVLALLSGIPTWTATTTFSGGLVYSAGNVTANCVTITGSADLCDANDATGAGGAFPFTTETNYNQTVNSTSTALWMKGTPISFMASSTAVFVNATTSQLTIGSDFVTDLDGSGLTLTSGALNCDTASGSVFGCLASADWMTFNNKQATIAVTWPVTLTGVNIGFNGLSTSSAAVIGNIPYFSGVNTFANVATGTLSATSPISVSGARYVIGGAADISLGTVGVANGGTGATTFGQGWLHSAGGTVALTSSTSPTLNYLIATSTTASSTFAGGLQISGGSLRVNGLNAANCDLKADTSGNFFCGSDATGAGGSFPFTTETNYGLTVNSTSTPIWFRHGTHSLMASGTAYFSGIKNYEWIIASSTTVCAFQCQYTSIQTALNAGWKDIRLKGETYAGPVSIDANDITIRGAGMYSSLITCNAAADGLCVSIATTTNRTRITLEDFGIDNTNASPLGVGLDTSDTSNVYTDRIRITDFLTGHLHQDTDNQSFYSSFNNMVYFDNTHCFATAGTLSNDNAINNARCRVGAAGGIGYKFVNAEGWVLNNVNSEPGSLIGTGLYVDGTSIGITAINPWFESNATGTEILAGALNTKIIGGRITGGTIGVYNRGTRTSVDNTLVSANTTNVDDTTVLSTWQNHTSAFVSPFFGIGTSTAISADTRLALSINTSSVLSPMLILNNAGGFATGYSGIMLQNSAGGFPNGLAKIGAEPGSGFTNTTLKFHVADSAKALQERMIIDVDGEIGVGTSTPHWLLQLASSTRPQLALSDSSLTSNHWTQRSTGNFLYFATSSPTTFATSSNTTLTLSNNGFVGVGTTTPQYDLTVAGRVLVYLKTAVLSAFEIISSTGTTILKVLDGTDYAGLTGRMGIASSTYNGIDYPDTLFVNGRINTGDWEYYDCYGAHTKATAQQTGDVSGSACATDDWWTFIEDANAVSDPVITSGSSYIRLRTGATGGLSAAGDGAGIAFETAMYRAATNTPAMEIEARIGQVQNATSTTFFMLGLTDDTTLAPDYATQSNGCMFVASSSRANWAALCGNAGVYTIVDTSVASSTVTTGDGNFKHFRIELSSTQAKFFIRSHNSNMSLVATITTNIPTTTSLNPLASVGRGHIGTTPELHVKRIKLWAKMPIW